MLAAIRQWFSTSKIYIVGVLLLFLLGVAGEVATAYRVRILSIPEGLISSLGEAFLVSGILAVLVDPLMKRRMQDDSAWGAIFGYLNPAAPEGLRKAVREVVEPRSYAKQSRWEVKFEWYGKGKEVIALEVDYSATFVNLDPKKGCRLTGLRWVLGSIPGHETEHLEFIVTCPASDFGALIRRKEELDPYIDRRGDGAILLDAGRLLKDCIIPPKASWSEVRKAVMYRNSSGYLSLHNQSYVEDLTVAVSGAALRDLEFYVTAPNRGSVPLMNWDGGATQSFETHLKENAPGQLILLSWGLPRREFPDRRSADGESIGGVGGE